MFNKSTIKAIPSSWNDKQRPALLASMAILLSGLVGGLASWLTQYFAGREILILLALIGFWIVTFFIIQKFDLMALVTFCFLSLVRLEPAPVDALAMVLLLVGILTHKISLKSLTGSSTIHLLLWLFVTMNLVALAVAPQFFDSLRYVIITLYLIALAYFLKMYLTSVQAMRIFLIGYLLSVIIADLLVILGYAGIFPAELVIVENRAISFFKDPNVFGPFAILMIVVLIDEIWHPRIFPGFNFLKILGVIIMSAILFLSFSRAALGNLGVSLLLYLVLNIKALSLTRIAKILIMFMVVLLVLAIVIVQLDLISFLEWRATPIQPYDLQRYTTQLVGLETGLSHPIGIGPGMSLGAHSLYVRTLVEYGFLGLIFLISSFIILLFLTFQRALRETGKPFGLSAKVLFACFSGVMLNSLVIDTLHWRYLWIIFALAWVLSTRESQSPQIDAQINSTNRRHST